MKAFLGMKYMKGGKVRTFPKDIKVHPSILDGTFGKGFDLKPVRGHPRENIENNKQ